MKQIYSIIIILFCVFTSQGQTAAQNLKVNDAWKYMHMLSADELNQRIEIGKYFQATDPPKDAVENIAEFEPMAGVLIAYPFGIPEQLIKEFANNDTVFTIVLNEDEKQFVLNKYREYDIEESHSKFIIDTTNTYWTRDYSPLFSAGDSTINITDFIYNRNRPQDDQIPFKLSQKLNYPYYAMNVVHTGGNHMTDGYGVAASSNIIYSESEDINMNKEEVDQQMLDYLGIKTFHVLEDPNNTYINHIDCWAKFLDVDKILIRSVSELHPQYSEIEAIANYFKNEQSSWGNNYQVYRVYTPFNEPYTNSFILNNRVFVPIMNNANDDAAIQTYKNAMPGYEVIGIHNNGWYSTDALHCRVHEIADPNMIRIKHIPIRGAQGRKRNFTIEATIKAYSNYPLRSDSVLVYYKRNSGDWKQQKMTKVNKNQYSVELPKLESDEIIQYYIYAVDETGKRASQPLVNKKAPYAFSTSDVFTDVSTINNSDEIKIYPNPVKDQLTIYFPQPDFKLKSIEITDIRGRILKSIDQVSNTGISYKINLSEFPKGIYIVRVHSDKSIKTAKINKH